MDLTIAPKPVVTIHPADQGIVSRKEYFVQLEHESIGKYPHPVLLANEHRAKPTLLYTTVDNEEQRVGYDLHFNRDAQNMFNEDKAEQVFISTPPPCYVIIGKPIAAVDTLATQMAREYNLVDIRVSQVVNKVLAMDNEVSAMIARLLRQQIAITTNILLGLVCYLAHQEACRHRGYLLTGIPCIPNDACLSVEQQLDYLFTWELKPTMFVHVLSEDIEVIDDRKGHRFLYENFILYECNDFSSIDLQLSPRFLSLGHNLEEEVWIEMEQYHHLVSDWIAILRTRVEPEYFLQIDGRVSNLMELVAARTQHLPLTPPSMPKRCFEKGAEDESQFLPCDEGFRVLFNRNLVCPGFRWELSHYNYFCPVAMRDNVLLNGITQYAVYFMKYIYFLSSEEALNKFIENPRPYVLPVRPTPQCRFAVTGYSKCGRTQLAKGLAKNYNVPYLNVQSLLERDVKVRRTEYREYCRQVAMQEKIVELMNCAWCEWREDEDFRQQCIEEWIEFAQKVLMTRITEFYKINQIEDEPQEAHYIVRAESDFSEFEETTTESSEEKKSTSDAYEVEYTPSDCDLALKKLMHAIRYKNFNLDPENLEIEATLFLSGLWNYVRSTNITPVLDVNIEPIEEYSGEGEAEEVEAAMTWCSLLPPQSLSSLLIAQRTLSLRPMNKDYYTMIHHASLHYKEHLTRAVEDLARLRLPCTMDIRLCEIFYDNPLLFLKYLPEELQQRPTLPEPIDETDERVIEAGTRAYRKAGVVEVKHDAADLIAIVCRELCEVEKRNKRSTGTVSTPGGWVLDDLPALPVVWRLLRNAQHLPYHILILEDSDADYHRLLDQWLATFKEDSLGGMEFGEEEMSSVFDSDDRPPEPLPENPFLKVIMKWLSILAGENETLEAYYQSVLASDLDTYYEEGCGLLPRSQSTMSNLSIVDANNTHLGPLFSIFRECLKTFFEDKDLSLPHSIVIDELRAELNQFFIDFFTERWRVNVLKKWLKKKSIDFDIIDVFEHTPKYIFKMVKRLLYDKFIKKPRPLEPFESEEVALYLKDSDAVKPEVKHAVVFGESAQFCIVALEEGLLVKGLPEFCLRYYGKLYMFANEGAKNAFIENPEKYAPFYSAIRCMPPPRIFVIGPLASGKTELTWAISKNWGIRYVDYLCSLSRYLIKHEHCISKLKDILTPKIVTEKHSGPAIKMIEIVRTLPFSVRSYWINETPALPEDEDEIEDFSNTYLSEVKSEVDLQPLPSDTTELPSETLKNILTAYAQDYVDLPAEYQGFAKSLWTKEPFLTQGFITDDYPYLASDVSFVVENNWKPDLIIEMEEPTEDRITKFVELLYEVWLANVEEARDEERRIQLAAKAIFDAVKSLKRKSLYAERLLELLPTLDLFKKGINLSKIGELNLDFETVQCLMENIPLEVKSALEEEVNALLDNEFGVFELDYEWESPENAKERLTNEMKSLFEKEKARVSAVKSALTTAFPDVLVTCVGESTTVFLNQLALKLDQLKTRYGQQCESCHVVDHETADTLVRQGFCYESRFGKRCPTQLFNDFCPVIIYPIHKDKITPMIYRSYVYYIVGEQSKDEFKANPLKFVNHKSSFTATPLIVSIIGGPKCGKSTLATKLANTFGWHVITFGSALRFVMEHIPNSHLASNLDEYLRKGCFVPLRLKIEAVVVAMNDPKYISNGCVFDGFPCDPATMRSLAEKNVLPCAIISLTHVEAKLAKMRLRAVDETKFRIPYKYRIDLQSRMPMWKKCYDIFLHWNKASYNNILEIDARQSRYHAFYHSVREKIFVVSRRMQNYVYSSYKNKALPLNYLSVDDDEFQRNQGVFKKYCPMCWALQNKLHHCVSSQSTFVQYMKSFYWICQKHYPLFLENPSIILPSADTFPSDFPIPASKIHASVADHLVIHGYGRCPVTRVDLPGNLDWEGNWLFAVSYKGQFYLMHDRKMYERFLAEPWRYENADTIFETSEKRNVLEKLIEGRLHGLPTQGFLEETVAEVLHRGLLLLGRVRPVHDSATPYATAACFVALYLKVNNPNKAPSWLDKMFLDNMLKTCLSMDINYKCRTITRPFFGEEDDEPDVTYCSDTESESSSLETSSEESGSLAEPQKEGSDSSSSQESARKIDLESLTLHYIWAARRIDPYELMMDAGLTASQGPYNKVFLKYQTYFLRTVPVPPFRCLNHIYSVRPTLTLPAPFNFNRIFETNTPIMKFGESIPTVFNPGKLYDTVLYSKNQIKDAIVSWAQLDSKESSVYTTDDSQTSLSSYIDPDIAYMIDNYLPRFQVLDSNPLTEIPIFPSVLDPNITLFNPHRDYTYTLIYSYFFPSFYYLSGWRSSFGEDLEINEFLRRQVYSETKQGPRQSLSAKSLNENHLYEVEFSEQCRFFIREKVWEPSLREMMVLLIDTIIDDVSKDENVSFHEIIDSILFNEMDYPSETGMPLLVDYSMTWSELDPSVYIRNFLPFPPTIQNMICRPYFSYTCVNDVFGVAKQITATDVVRFSALDGTAAPTLLHNIKFFHHVGNVDKSTSDEDDDSEEEPLPIGFLPVFEHLDIPWTSFLPYPFSWSYNMDFKDNFEIDITEKTEQPTTETT